MSIITGILMSDLMLFFLSELSYNIEVASPSSFCGSFNLWGYCRNAVEEHYCSPLPHVCCVRGGWKASWMSCAGLALVSFQHVLHPWSSRTFWGNINVWNESWKSVTELWWCVSSQCSSVHCLEFNTAWAESYSFPFCCCFNKADFLYFWVKQKNSIFCICLSPAVRLLPCSVVGIPVLGISAGWGGRVSREPFVSANQAVARRGAHVHNSCWH